MNALAKRHVPILKRSALTLQPSTNPVTRCTNRAYSNTSEADVKNRVSVTLNLTASQMMLQSLDTPCWGADAKSLGKARLEEEFDVDVAFESYQEAPGKPKLWLEDDATVVRGSVLNFGVQMEAVLCKRSKYDKTLAMLSAPMLQDLVCRWAARLLTGKATGPAAAKTKLQALVASNSIVHQSLSAALTSVNAKLSAEQVAEALDSTYQHRCDNTHLDSTAMLRNQMEEMRESGVLELLNGRFPVECLIVQNHEVFVQMLT